MNEVGLCFWPQMNIPLIYISADAEIETEFSDFALSHYSFYVEPDAVFHAENSLF